MGALAIALEHYPEYNRYSEVICTNITPFDLHDIARSARTYNLSRYFVVHPYSSQRRLAERIIQYWTEGVGGQANPDRKEALKLISIKASLNDALREMTASPVNGNPWLVFTDARPLRQVLSFAQMRSMLRRRKGPCLLVFGTGWGIVREEIEQADYFLEPIASSSDYNHLSVRTAAGIILDRLFRPA